jgi:Protein of unknown function (DUF2490)
MKRFFIVVILIFYGILLKSQSIYQQAYWLRLYARLKFNDKWTLHAETDYRRFTNPDRLWQNYNQLHLHYRFHKNWETVAALGYAQVWQGLLPVPEWRPYQDIQYFHPLGKGWQLAYRGRIEERFIHHSSKTELTEGFNFRVRPRARVQLSKVFNAQWTSRLSEEYFYQFGDGFNQVQTWLTVERILNKGFLLDIGYQKAFVKRPSGGYINRDNIRFSLIKHFNV